MKVLDIFSGIGGFSLGLEKAGMETVGFCEIEPFCQSILKKYRPESRLFNDIRILDKEKLLQSGISKVDVIAGGFPCQDISCAGKQIGITGNRSGLWKEFKRLINELRPNYAIIENVANLRSRGLITVLQDLWEIGYDAQWHCIPASAIGAPHRRDRVWVIAYPNGTSAKRLPFGKEKKKSLLGINRKNISNANYQGCYSNKSTPTRKNDQEGWQECFENSITGRNIIAREGFPLHKAGSSKQATRTELQNSKAVLANSNSSRQVGIRGANNNASQESGCRRINSEGSRGNDRRQYNTAENEKMANSNCKGLQGHGRFEEACQILTQEEISLFCCSRGIEQWGFEPESIPRLKEGRLNPDWVEWLMGFPIGWTEGGTRKQRLVALGNAVVPQIPELIGVGIINKAK